MSKRGAPIKTLSIPDRIKVCSMKTEGRRDYEIERELNISKYLLKKTLALGMPTDEEIEQYKRTRRGMSDLIFRRAEDEVEEKKRVIFQDLPDEDESESSSEEEEDEDANNTEDIGDPNDESDSEEDDIEADQSTTNPKQVQKNNELLSELITLQNRINQIMIQLQSTQK